jgi:hypothetical protein
MKKSELKEYIKEAIIAELTEDMKGAVELPIGTAASAIKKYTDQNIDVELVPVKETTDPASAKIEDAIKSGKIDPKEVEAAAKKAMNGDSTDLALMMAGFGKMFEAKKDEEDTEDDEEKLDKKAQAAAKKGGGKVGKLQRVTAQLKELEKEMKELVGKWKKAEGKEKETLLDKLKEKTKVKKELEALEDKLADAIV